MSTHRITVTASTDNESRAKQTGWHYHDCQVQWVWLIDGWVEMQLEDGSTRRQEAGSILVIPGGYGHNEIAASEEIDLIEIFMPPNPETVSIDVPEAWR
jgi:quercetin dioxygenase-like cupin family protein